MHLKWLNIKTKVDDAVVRFLANINLKISKKQLKLLSIEHFLEEYLHKCYIPEDNEDLHYLDDMKPFALFQYIQKRISSLVVIIKRGI